MFQKFRKLLLRGYGHCGHSNSTVLIPRFARTEIHNRIPTGGGDRQSGPKRFPQAFRGVAMEYFENDPHRRRTDCIDQNASSSSNLRAAAEKTYQASATNLTLTPSCGFPENLGGGNA